MKRRNANDCEQKAERDSAEWVTMTIIKHDSVSLVTLGRTLVEGSRVF